MNRRNNLTIVLILAVIAAAFAAAELAIRKSVVCERCGTAMRPFKEGEPREDSEIFECPQCGFMVNSRHTRR